MPPSNAFNCDTSELVALRQRGWTDQEILDILFDDEAESGHSPSLLGEDDVRALARQQDADSHDEHVAIQVICSEIHHGGSSGAFKASVPSAVPPRHDFDPKCDQCSFTDEFLQAISVAETAQQEPAPRIPTSDDSDDSPTWVQLVRDQWTSLINAEPVDQQHRNIAFQ